jgi:hypothetical protein
MGLPKSNSKDYKKFKKETDPDSKVSCKHNTLNSMLPIEGFTIEVY